MVDAIEMAERLARIEARQTQLERAYDDEAEERLRVMGQLALARDELRKARERLDEIEDWRTEQDGTVRQVTRSLRVAGGAFRAVPIN